ncbi:MAG: hypothetical protein AAGL66_09925 [Pseudomonadota bacterium]
MHGGVNRWLSAELIATVKPPDAALRPPAVGGAPLRPTGPGETRIRPQRRQTRPKQGFSTLLLRAAVVTLLSACAAFSYVTLSEAAAGLRWKSADVAAGPKPAPVVPVALPLVQATRQVEAAEAAEAAEKLSDARARANSLRETNYLLRNRLSELQAALKGSTATTDSEQSTLEVPATGTD